jgi:aminomethyltransferase
LHAACISQSRANATLLDLEGAKILTAGGGESIGTITSGIPSPTLGKNIAMGYVKNGLHKKGTEIEVEVRNKLRKAVITGMPFVPTNYYRG